MDINLLDSCDSSDEESYIFNTQFYKDRKDLEAKLKHSVKMRKSCCCNSYTSVILGSSKCGKCQPNELREGRKKEQKCSSVTKFRKTFPESMLQESRFSLMKLNKTFFERSNGTGLSKFWPSNINDADCYWEFDDLRKKNEGLFYYLQRKSYEKKMVTHKNSDNDQTIETPIVNKILGKSVTGEQYSVIKIEPDDPQYSQQKSTEVCQNSVEKSLQPDKIVKSQFDEPPVKISDFIKLKLGDDPPVEKSGEVLGKLNHEPNVVENAEESDIYYDFYQGKRCPKMLRDYCNDVHCRYIHRLPKEDGVYCKHFVRSKCKFRNRCHYLHEMPRSFESRRVKFPTNEINKKSQCLLGDLKQNVSDEKNRGTQKDNANDVIRINDSIIASKNDYDVAIKNGVTSSSFSQKTRSSLESYDAFTEKINNETMRTPLCEESTNYPDLTDSISTTTSLDSRTDFCNTNLMDAATNKLTTENHSICSKYTKSDSFLDHRKKHSNQQKCNEDHAMKLVTNKSNTVKDLNAGHTEKSTQVHKSSSNEKTKQYNTNCVTIDETHGNAPNTDLKDRSGFMSLKIINKSDENITTKESLFPSDRLTDSSSKDNRYSDGKDITGYISDPKLTNRSLPLSPEYLDTIISNSDSNEEDTSQSSSETDEEDRLNYLTMTGVGAMFSALKCRSTKTKQSTHSKDDKSVKPDQNAHSEDNKSSKLPLKCSSSSIANKSMIDNNTRESKNFSCGKRLNTFDDEEDEEDRLNYLTMTGVGAMFAKPDQNAHSKDNKSSNLPLKFSNSSVANKSMIDNNTRESKISCGKKSNTFDDEEEDEEDRLNYLTMTGVGAMFSSLKSKSTETKQSAHSKDDKRSKPDRNDHSEDYKSNLPLKCSSSSIANKSMIDNNTRESKIPSCGKRLKTLDEGKDNLNKIKNRPKNNKLASPMLSESNETSILSGKNHSPSLQNKFQRQREHVKENLGKGTSSQRNTISPKSAIIPSKKDHIILQSTKSSKSKSYSPSIVTEKKCFNNNTDSDNKLKKFTSMKPKNVNASIFIHERKKPNLTSNREFKVLSSLDVNNTNGTISKVGTTAKTVNTNKSKNSLQYNKFPKVVLKRLDDFDQFKNISTSKPYKLGIKLQEQSEKTLSNQNVSKSRANSEIPKHTKKIKKDSVNTESIKNEVNTQHLRCTESTHTNTLQKRQNNQSQHATNLSTKCSRANVVAKKGGESIHKKLKSLEQLSTVRSSCEDSKNKNKLCVHERIKENSSNPKSDNVSSSSQQNVSDSFIAPDNSGTLKKTTQYSSLQNKQSIRPKLTTCVNKERELRHADKGLKNSSKTTAASPKYSNNINTKKQSKHINLHISKDESELNEINARKQVNESSHLVSNRKSKNMTSTSSIQNTSDYSKSATQSKVPSPISKPVKQLDCDKVVKSTSHVTSNSSKLKIEKKSDMSKALSSQNLSDHSKSIKGAISHSSKTEKLLNSDKTGIKKLPSKTINPPVHSEPHIDARSDNVSPIPSQQTSDLKPFNQSTVFPHSPKNIKNLNSDTKTNHIKSPASLTRNLQPPLRINDKKNCSSKSGVLIAETKNSSLMNSNGISSGPQSKPNSLKNCKTSFPKKDIPMMVRSANSEAHTDENSCAKEKEIRDSLASQNSKVTISAEVAHSKTLVTSQTNLSKDSLTGKRKLPNGDNGDDENTQRKKFKDWNSKLSLKTKNDLSNTSFNSQNDVNIPTNELIDKNRSKKLPSKTASQTNLPKNSLTDKRKLPNGDYENTDRKKFKDCYSKLSLKSKKDLSNTSFNCQNDGNIPTNQLIDKNRSKKLPSKTTNPLVRLEPHINARSNNVSPTPSPQKTSDLKRFNQAIVLPHAPKNVKNLNSGTKTDQIKSPASLTSNSQLPLGINDKNCSFKSRILIAETKNSSLMISNDISSGPQSKPNSLKNCKSSISKKDIPMMVQLANSEAHTDENSCAKEKEISISMASQNSRVPISSEVSHSETLVPSQTNLPKELLTGKGKQPHADDENTERKKFKACNRKLSLETKKDLSNTNSSGVPKQPDADENTERKKFKACKSKLSLKTKLESKKDLSNTSSNSQNDVNIPTYELTDKKKSVANNNNQPTTSDVIGLTTDAHVLNSNTSGIENFDSDESNKGVKDFKSSSTENSATTSSTHLSSTLKPTHSNVSGELNKSSYLMSSKLKVLTNCTPVSSDNLEMSKTIEPAKLEQSKSSPSTLNLQENDLLSDKTIFCDVKKDTKSNFTSPINKHRKVSESGNVIPSNANTSLKPLSSEENVNSNNMSICKKSDNLESANINNETEYLLETAKIFLGKFCDNYNDSNICEKFVDLCISNGVKDVETDLTYKTLDRNIRKFATHKTIQKFLPNSKNPSDNIFNISLREFIAIVTKIVKKN